MTKKTIALGVVGIVLALAWIGWEMQAQAQEPLAGTTGHGHFRLTVGPSGVTCFQNNSNTYCQKSLTALPKETIVSVKTFAVIQTLDAQGGDPCYFEFNGTYTPIPC